MSVEPKEKGVTTRPAAVALLVVDSNDEKVFNNGIRIDDKTPAQVYINNQRPLIFGYCTRLALTEMNINWATPNVNITNNTLTMGVQSSSGDRTQRLTIPERFYKPSELATAIQTQFIAQFGTFLNYSVVGGGNPLGVSFDIVSNSFTLQANSDSGAQVWDNFTFGILPGIKYPANAPSIPVTLQAVADDLTGLMGITPVSEGLAVSTLTLKGGFASMQYTPYIDVVSNLLTKNQNVSDGDTHKSFTSSKLARVYFSNEHIENRTEDNIPGTRPFSFRREFITPKQIQWNNTENVDFCDISILDHNGRVIYVTPLQVISAGGGDTITIGNQADVQFTIQVTEI